MTASVPLRPEYGDPTADELDAAEAVEWRSAVTAVDAWIDRESAETYRDQPLAQDWARVAKIGEEAGEAVAALIAMTGQNPRKGVCGTREELLAELADTAWTAILAIQHFTKNAPETFAVLETGIAKIAGRVP